MSGIFGWTTASHSKEQFNVNTEALHLWNQLYGQKDNDVYLETNICLGCCYEKLSDEAICSSPVLKFASKRAVFDTVLYNRDEVQTTHEASQMSDEEFLFHYIRQFGIDSLKNVNGDFSGAIYDEEQNSITLFRDHLGIRPLFYYADKSFVAFSTDIRGLLSLSQVNNSINETWLFETISGYSTLSPTGTEFANIFCVPPGGYITFTFHNGIFVPENKLYWKIGQRKIRLKKNEYKIQLKNLITDSVRRRLNAVSGVVGAELSGGLDSSVIDILIHRLGRECIYFSWSPSFEDVPLVPNDERIVIEDICKQENITCHYKNITDDFGETSLPALHMKQLGFSLNPEERTAYRYTFPPYANTYTICATSQYLKQEGAKVVFTGHGGDEGVSHRNHPYELLYYHEYWQFIKQLWLSTKEKKNRIKWFAIQCRDVLKKAIFSYHRPYKTPVCLPQLLNPAFANKFREQDMEPLTFAYDPITYIRTGGSRNRLDNVALQGALCGVRYLIPYLDYRVVDYAVSIPRYLYRNGNQNRFIFREAFKDIIPSSLYSLQAKDSPSTLKIKPTENGEEKLEKLKKQTVEKLDRSFWNKYLNFEYIDSWINNQITDSDGSLDYYMIQFLSVCGQYQNLIEKTKG